jgi:hypothetical protein
MSLYLKPEPFIPTARTTVQDKDASMYAFYMAVALDYYQLGFVFQYAIEGGWMRSGGQVIDFMVATKPLITPLEVNEEYWHKDEAHEALMASKIREALGPGYADPKAVWGEECDTQEKAMTAVWRLFIE